MEVNRNLYHTNINFQTGGVGQIVEAGDLQAAVLAFPMGTVVSDEDAKKYGLDVYLAEHPEAPSEPKAPEPAAEPTAEPPADPEAKAVDQEETEDKGVHFPPSGRRSRG